MITELAVGTAIILTLKKILSLKDSAEKLMFSFAGAAFKGGSWKTGFSGGLMNPQMNLELFFKGSNPGATTLKLDFLMLDCVLELGNGDTISLTKINIEDLEERRKNNPTLFTFPSRKTNTITIPVQFSLFNIASLQLIKALFSGDLNIKSIGAKGYIMANGFRVEINEKKEFGKKEEVTKPT